MDGISYITGCWGGDPSRRELLNMTCSELMGVQYKINMPGTAQCPLLNNLSNYIGIVLSPRLANIATDYTYTGGDVVSIIQYLNVTKNNRYLAIFGGINHT